MKQKEFDNYLRDAFEKASLPYEADNWRKLSATLDEQRERKRRIILWPLASIAASIAMALGITTWINYDRQQPVQANKIERSTGQQTSKPAIQKTTPTVQQQTLTYTASPAKNKSHAATTAIHEAVSEATIEPPLVYNQQPAIAQAALTAETLISSETKEPTVVEKKRLPDIITLNELPKYYDASDYTKSNRKPFISMSGGLNYGTLNGGYVMGFAAGKKISNRIYLEGDIAFVGNIGGEKTKYTFVQKTQAYAKGTSVQPTTSSQTIQRFYNLYYAQFTPTIGYQMSKNLTLGVGADMQRLLMNDVLITETDKPEDAMQLPTFDMGLVGKTEYKLSKEIRASVYYRKAMNQALQSNSKLLNRDYLQVQLKFTILGK